MNDRVAWRSSAASVDPMAGHDAGASVRGPIGILMLETSFHRYPGDIGNPATWRLPPEVSVVFRTVAGAVPSRITRLDDPSFLDAFARAGAALVAEGVAALTTSCGYLAVYQRELAARLPVPIATSALLQVPFIEAMLPAGRRAGVVTFDAMTLGPSHLAGAGCRADTPVAGLVTAGRFQQAVLGEATTDGYEIREAEAVEAADRLRHGSPYELGAVVLECTNLAPHAAAIASYLDLPVYDIVTMVRWLAAGLTPPRWPRL